MGDNSQLRPGPVHLAQVNVARIREPLGSPVMAGFVAGVDPISRLAEESPGFVWRLPPTESHGATMFPDGDFTVILNLSVWASYEQLHAFVYRSPHGAYVRQRGKWFLPRPAPSTALWWVQAGAHPTGEEGWRRLQHLGRYGPSPQAFTMRRRFGPDGGLLRGR